MTAANKDRLYGAAFFVLTWILMATVYATWGVQP